MKTHSVFLFCWAWLGPVLWLRPPQAQPLQMADCLTAAAAHSPYAAQRALYEAGHQAQLELLRTANRPQVELNAQATWQSEVTSLTLPDNLPFSLDITPPPQDQYRATLDLRQNLWDGGLTAAQRNLQMAQNQADLRQNDLDQYQLRDRVQQLFFSILLLDAQLEITRLLKADLEARTSKLEALAREGAALPTAVRSLQAEAIKADQRLTELRAARLGALRALAQLTGQPLADDAALAEPPLPAGAEGATRPETNLLLAQMQLSRAREEVLRVKNRPKVSAFATAGYGRPGLNFLATTFGPYFIGGVAVKWPLADRLSGRYKQEAALAGIQREGLGVQLALFEQNRQAQLAQHLAEQAKYDELLRQDETLIGLRAQNRAAAAAQLELGVMTASDYASELNAEAQAREQQALHRLQQIQALWRRYWIEGGR
jgi:outer membrane protein TolC